MQESVFDRYKILKTIDDRGSISVYLVEEIASKKKFALKKIPADLSNPAYEEVKTHFVEMSSKSVKIFRKADSPALVDFFSEEGNSYFLLDYKDEKNLKNITSYTSIGKILNNRYVIVRGISGGGFGVVYLARDLSLPGKYWAIKEMKREGPEPEVIENSFRVEAKMLSTLEHPRIPSISDFFVEEDKLYLVMEYVKGETLKKMLKELGQNEFYSEEQVVNWTLSICDVLEYLHNRPNPVVFRDLKPDNIMITPGGELKLIDFGIARVFESGKANITHHALLTQGYAPPEQWIGKTDVRSDIYSLGVTMYYLLTRVDPREVAPEFPPVTKFNSKVSPGLSKLILKAVAIKLKDRCQSISEMKNALLDLCKEKLTKEKVDSHLSRAKEYEGREDFFNANFEYMKALEADEGNYEILTGAGNCCEKLGFKGKALDYYRRALNCDVPDKQRNYIREKIDNLEGSKTAELAFFEEDDEREIMNKLKACADIEKIEAEPGQSEDIIEIKEVPSEMTLSAEMTLPVPLPETKEKTVKMPQKNSKFLIPCSIIGMILILAFLLNYNNIFKKPIPEAEVTPISSPVMNTPPSVPPSLAPTATPEYTIKEKLDLLKNYYEKEDYEKCMGLVDEILKEDEKNIEALIALGNCYRKEDKPEEALREYKKALEIDPENQEAHLNRGHIYRKNGEMVKAVEEYKKAGNLSAAHNNLGAIYAQEGNIDEAIKEFEVAKEMEPGDYRTCINLGNAYYLKEDWKKSIKYYSEALEIEPDSGEAYYNLGLSYRNKGASNKSVKSFERFIELLPDDPRVPDARKYIEELK